MINCFLCMNENEHLCPECQIRLYRLFPNNVITIVIGDNIYDLTYHDPEKEIPIVNVFTDGFSAMQFLNNNDILNDSDYKLFIRVLPNYKLIEDDILWFKIISRTHSVIIITELSKIELIQIGLVTDKDYVIFYVEKISSMISILESDVRVLTVMPPVVNQ